MTNFKENKRNFNCSDTSLLSGAETMHGSYLIDEADFTAYDPLTFTTNFKDDLHSDIELGRRFPTDELILDQLKGETIEVEEQVKNFEPHYQELKYFVRKAFPTKKTIWQEFGFDDYRKACKSVSKLLTFIDLLSVNALRFATELIAAGYTQAKIDEIANFYNSLSAENTKQEVFKKRRLTVTNDRINIMNNVYSKLELINYAAKIIYRDNYAKLQTYKLPREISTVREISLEINANQTQEVSFTLKGSFGKKVRVYWDDESNSEYEMQGPAVVNIMHSYIEQSLYSIKIRNKISEITELNMQQSNISSFIYPASLNKMKKLNLAGNNISENKQIAKILYNLNMTPVENGYVNLSGGNNAKPTRDGEVYKDELINKGWTVITN